MTLYIGYDPGYNANKLAMVAGDEIITVVLPSSVGAANRTIKDGLTLGGVVTPGRRTQRPYHVAFDGLEYLAGPNVGDYTDPIDRLDFDRFTDSPELRATFYAGVYQIAGGDKTFGDPKVGPRHPGPVRVRVALAMALPVTVVLEKSEAIRVEKRIREWLAGEHRFSIDGVNAALTVTNVRAKIPQPVATWYAWGMNNKGEWVRGKEAQRAPALIIDVGFNTLDVLVVEDARISERISEGNTLGIRRAAERLLRSLEHRYGLELELRQANGLVEAVVNGRPAETYVRGRLVDVSGEARRAVQSLTADVYNYLDRAVGKARGAYTVILTGGGALALSETLLRQFPGATMMHEPVLANARGLAKLAARKGFL